MCYFFVALCTVGAAVRGTWVPSQDGCTALMHAARHGHMTCVRVLLDAGSDKAARTSYVRAMFEICFPSICSLLFLIGECPVQAGLIQSGRLAVQMIVDADNNVHSVRFVCAAVWLNGLGFGREGRLS